MIMVLLGRSLTILLALAFAAVPMVSEARNRTNEELRQANFARFTEAQMRGRVEFLPREDDELAPGIFFSPGGHVTRNGDDFHTFYTAQIFNTTRHDICLRVRHHMAAGPLVGRERLSNAGKNILLEAGGKQAIASYTSNAAPSGAVDFRHDALMWLPYVDAPDGRICGSGAPPDLDLWSRQPVNNSAPWLSPELEALFTDRLYIMAGNYVPGTSSAARQLTNLLRGEGVAVDRNGYYGQVYELAANKFGVFEEIAAVALTRSGVRVLLQLRNSSSIPLCFARHQGLDVRFDVPGAQKLAPARGFFIGANNIRDVIDVTGQGLNPIKIDPNARYMIWDAPPGASTDSACEASHNRSDYARLVNSTDPGLIIATGRAENLVK